MKKKPWMALLGGVCIGVATTGGAWEVTHAMTKQGPIVASVGGKAIHRTEFDTQIDQTVGSQALTTLIEERLVNDAAQKDGLTATTTEINNMLQSFMIQQGITSESALQSALTANGMTMAELNTELKAEILAQKVAEHNVHVTTAQMQQYYKTHASSFKVPATVTISGIVVKSEAAAQSAEKRIQQGDSFAAVAKAVSTDSASKNQGGAMGSLSKSSLDPALQSVAFTLPIGTLSSPIKTSAGWEIIKVTRRKSAYTKTQSQAKSQITQILKQQNAVTPPELFAQLAKTDKITIDNPAFSGVKTQIENPQSSTTQG